MSCFVGIFDCLREVFNPKSIKGRDVNKAYYNDFVQPPKPVRVAITGVAGQIGYALLPMIANGDMFGDREVIIQGVDLNIDAVKANLRGIQMELDDGYYPKLQKVIFTTDPNVAFKDADVAILLGAFPRKQGMERKDLMEKNISIFKTMGTAIEQNASKDIKILVVGNPANTNCLVCSKYAPSIPKKNFSALTRLDHNRAKGQIALKAGAQLSDVKNVMIWGNHSSTQYPDTTHATIQGKAVDSVIPKAWLQKDFVGMIQTRGAAIINARKASSALSAARAITNHVHDWMCGTKVKDELVSMAVFTDGTDGYNIEKGLIYSFPVTCSGGGNWEIKKGLPVDGFSQQKMKDTEAELVEERELAFQLVN
jgi:malate dehydrogenase